MDRTRCDRCGKIVSSQELLTLDRGSISPAEHICNDCYNQGLAQRAGIDYRPLRAKTLTVQGIKGTEHVFSLTQLIHGNSLGIIAQEVTENDTPGFRFSVQGEVNEKQADLLERLTRKIEKNISAHYVGHHRFTGRTVPIINGFTVAGRVEASSSSESSETPTLVIDGKSYSWEELGRLITKFEGFQFKLDFIDMTDDLMS